MMNSKLYLRGALLAGASAVTFAISSGAAFAQTNDTPEMAVEEITVTARKQSESILEAPLAITALSSEQLQDKGIAGYAQLNSFVPNFRFQEMGSGSNSRTYFTVTTRGIFPGSAAPERQATSVFLDGVPIGGGGTIAGLTDIEQVEVVNGPQSAYFGRSTFSGAVNFITRAPGDAFRADASVDYGSFDNHEFKASVEGAIVPGLLTARISGRDWHRGAQYDNYGFGGKLGEQNTKSVGGALKFTPTESLTIRAYATAFEDKDGPSATGLLYTPDYNCNAGAGVNGARNYVCGKISSVPANRISQNTNVSTAVLDSIRNGNRVVGPGFIDDFGVKRIGRQAYVSAEYSLPGGFTVDGNVGTSANKWAQISDPGNRFTPQNSTFLIPYNIKAKSAELRVSSSSDKRLRGLIGANWFQQRTYAGNVRNTNGVFSTSSAYNLAMTDTIGFFGSLGYDVTDKLKVSLEGRAQKDRVRQDVIATPGVEADGTTWSYTPRAIVSYSLQPDMELYASYAQGTRPVQFNTAVFALSPAAQAQILAQAPVQLKVDEEQLRMWEVGFKGVMFDRRLRILAAAYYGDWSDRQIQVLLPYTNGAATSTATVILPDGQVDLYGVELQAQFRVTEEFGLEGTFGYAETEIGKTSCTDCRSITGNLNPVGNRLQRYPAYTGTLSATYERPLTDDIDFFGRLDYIYTGKQYDTEANTTWTAASSKFNMRVGLRNDRYRFEFYGVNIFDDETPVGINRVADTYNSTNNIILAPPERRTFGVFVGVSY